MTRTLDMMSRTLVQGRLQVRWVKNRLRVLRAETGLSQGELAQALGVSRQTINAVETDKYDPSLPLALRMAKVFGVPVTDIFLDDWTPLAKEGSR